VWGLLRLVPIRAVEDSEVSAEAMEEQPWWNVELKHYAWKLIFQISWLRLSLCTEFLSDLCHSFLKHTACSLCNFSLPTVHWRALLFIISHQSMPITELFERCHRTLRAHFSQGIAHQSNRYIQIHASTCIKPEFSHFSIKFPRACSKQASSILHYWLSSW